MNKDFSITVIQVFDALGVKPQREQSWSVGGRVAAMYRSEMGHEPPKENRPKTDGKGSHCFAIYPLSWFERIALVVRTVCDVDKRQLYLFFAEETSEQGDK